MSDKPLKGHVILVTGASRGIGYASAVKLAEAGAHIIAIARTQGGLEDLDDAVKSAGSEATLVPMDLKSPDGLDQLAAIIHERWGRLDGLFGNAGLLGDIMPAQQIDPKTYDSVFAINMTANYRLIRAMDPLLRAAAAGRALFVTSSVAQSHRAYWSAYAASKAALEAYVSCWAKEIDVTNVRANVLDPGAVRTAMRAKAMPGEDGTTLPNPSDVAALVTEMLSPSYAENDAIIRFRDTGYFKPA